MIFLKESFPMMLKLFLLLAVATDVAGAPIGVSIGKLPWKLAMILIL